MIDRREMPHINHDRVRASGRVVQSSELPSHLNLLTLPNRISARWRQNTPLQRLSHGGAALGTGLVFTASGLNRWELAVAGVAVFFGSVVLGSASSFRDRS
jgi:hypothetical protein